MKNSHLIPSLALFFALSAGHAPAQQKVSLADNAALRYWAAFAQMQDSAITDDDARQLNGILDGSIPYDDSKYKELAEKNKPALDTLARGAAFANCDWGLDYRLGDDIPVQYVRKALALARLNVLYAFHQGTAGDKDGAVRTLAAGLRFSHDVANGGTLFSALVAKQTLVEHFRAMTFLLRSEQLSSAQRSLLERALAQLGPEALDWHSAIKRETALLDRPPWQGSVPLGRITQAYIGALDDPSTLPELRRLIATVPQPLQDVIPSPKRVVAEKQDLTDQLRKVRSSLR